MKNPQTFEILIALMLASTVLIIPIAQHMVYYDEKILEYEHLAEEAKYPAKKQDLISTSSTYIWKINMMGLSFLFTTSSAVTSISGLFIFLFRGINSEKVLKYIACLSIVLFLCSIVVMASVISLYPIP